MGAGVALGVPRLDIAGFVTIGVSFQFAISLAREGGGTEGAGFLGGAPNEPDGPLCVYPIEGGIAAPA
jgi:hypothetical protein